MRCRYGGVEWPASMTTRLLDLSLAWCAAIGAQMQPACTQILRAICPRADIIIIQETKNIPVSTEVTRRDRIDPPP
jgi:hypothetical protein